MAIASIFKGGILLGLLSLMQTGLADYSGGGNAATSQPPAKPGVLIAAPAPAINLLDNGGFETNNGVATLVFANWTVVANSTTQSTSGWYVQTGITSPVNTFAVEMPVEGDFSAMTESDGPSSSILYRDFQVPSGGAQLSCDIYVNNQATDFFNNGTLSDDSNAGPNQYIRMDIMNTSAPLNDVGAGVLQNLFITNPGDALVQSYQTVTADLSMFSGQTVRLRFAEVDNQFFLNAGVDNCILQALAPVIPAQSVPALSRLTLLFLSLLLLAAVFSGLSRRRTW
jgi:hypothetical protein